MAALGAGIALPWRQRRRVGAAIDDILDDASYTRAVNMYRDSMIGEDGVGKTSTRSKRWSPEQLNSGTLACSTECCLLTEVLTSDGVVVALIATAGEGLTLSS